MVTSNVDAFLKKSNELLETSKADIETVKKNLKTVHKTRPDLVDPEIFNTLNRIAENIEIAKDAKAKVEALTTIVASLEKKIDQQTKQITELKSTRQLINLNNEVGERLLK